MSKTTPTASSSSNIGAIIEESLTKYEEQTKKDLRTHPLMAKLKPEANKSTAEILATFRTQVEQFKKFASGDDKLMKSLNPIVNVLCAFSSVIGAGVGLAFSPANVIFAGAGVLLSVAKDVIASHDALIEIFERIGRVFNRLEEYTDMQEMEAIKDIIIEIMVEVLKIFAIMTKAVEQGRTKRLLKVFFKRLIGRTDIKDALSRLDKLTQEEVKMVLAQVWKATDRIEGRLGTVSEGLNVVGDNVNRLIKDGKDREAHKNEEKRRQEIEETRKHVRDDKKWLSPPDPSTNQNKNIASHARRKGSATWFFKENIFIEWKSKSTTSLLWIHGKPGSGKSVLCSAIIKDIMVLQQKRLATMAYFYFDFKDTTKQSRHNALLSLLTQLSACSNGYCDILCGVYKEHNNGTYQPDTEKMVECLKEMLTLPDQPPVYIFLDALDECPKTSGVPPARKQVLDLLKDLVDLRLSSLHICVTSRRESDIEAALQRISSHSSISIQNQSGQKKDIEDYIKFVVYAESDTAMGEWSDEDRRLVIKTLTERADGMFQWVFCQLEVLQHCFPQSIQQTLDDLPDSLDETYERVLKEIGKANRDLALRLLQCLTMAVRPLRVEELTAILALEFDGAKGAIPKVIEGSPSEKQQRMVLSTCSSLVTVVGNGYSRVIQFSHFTVKEYLTSDRLATLKDISWFHIKKEPAHTTLAQACLGTLLQLDGTLNNGKVERSFPFAIYASQHWVEHARLGTMSSRIEDGMRHLFDSAKPHFAAWLQLHDMDERWVNFATSRITDLGSPLYYASLCGFRDLAKHIIVEHPEQVNARGGRNHSPLVAALHKRHLKVAEILHQHGAVVDMRQLNNRTPLYAASMEGLIDVVRWLLTHGADAEAQDIQHQTPIMTAAQNGHLEVVQTLLGHGVRINAMNNRRYTALHQASRYGYEEIVGLLLKHGADTSIQDEDSGTPLPGALSQEPEVARLLLDHVADVDAKSNFGETPLHLASSEGGAEVVRLLLERGANVNAKDNKGRTPLHLVSTENKPEIVRLLLDRGASVNAKDNVGRSPYWLASALGKSDIVRMLTEHGAQVD